MISPNSIVSDGLVLRPFTVADAAEFVNAVLESMGTVGRWMPWCHANYAIEDALEWFSYCDKSRLDGSEYSFGIFNANTNEFLGGVGLNEINRKNRSSANLGYWIRESCQRQGIATKAIQVCRDFGFRELNLTRIEIVAIESNTASNAAAKRAGAQFECLARNGLVMNGLPYTAAVYSLIPPTNI